MFGKPAIILAFTCQRPMVLSVQFREHSARRTKGGEAAWMEATGFA
jgi:hypothetical protein